MKNDFRVIDNPHAKQVTKNKKSLSCKNSLHHLLIDKQLLIA